MIPFNYKIPPGTIRTIKNDGYPPDGRYKIILAPNGREHVGHVNGPFIQLAGDRRPVYMMDMLGQNDQWCEYGY